MFNGTFTSLELDTEVEELVSILTGCVFHPRYGGLESLPLTPAESPGCLVSRLLLLPDSEMESWLLLSVTSDRGSLERRVQLEIRPPIMSPFLVCIEIF